MAEKKPVQQAVPTEAETDAHVDDLVNKALKALEEFEDFTQEQVDYIVAKCSVAGLDHHGILAEAEWFCRSRFHRKQSRLGYF